jgi:Na+/H+ antiporter NhaC
MASATDHVDHVKTQLPYALTAGGLAALLYLILGIVM